MNEGNAQSTYIGEIHILKSRKSRIIWTLPRCRGGGLFGVPPFGSIASQRPPPAVAPTIPNAFLHTKGASINEKIILSYIFYNNNSWSYTRLGKIVSTLPQGSESAGSSASMTPSELKKILGKGNVTAEFDILR